jgi:putative CocE/NonD family hydrolase
LNHDVTRPPKSIPGAAWPYRGAVPDSRAHGHPPDVLTRLAERLAGRRFGLERATTRYRISRRLPVPMRDGVQLLADHYAPVTSTPAGTLLLRGPYTRDALPTRVVLGLYAARGYHVVLQSTRGSFGSGGVFEPGHGEVEDGVDTVDWLRRQPWFTGTFATVGGSYLGFTQLALLADPQPELATAVVTMGPHDIGRAAWGTGTFALSDFLTWGYQMAWHERGGFFRQLVRTVLTPRRLEPAFGQLPLSAAADAVMGGGSPFYESWLDNADPSGDYWRRRAVAFEAAQQPVLLIGGWQDLFFDQTMAQFLKLRDNGVAVALVIGPWTHGEGGGVAIRESLDWLAGRRRSEPVRIFVTGDGGWRDLPDWPPPSTATVLHPLPGAMLADAPAVVDTRLSFVYDPADPTPTIGGRLLLASAAGYRDDGALARRSDALTFTGPELVADLEVIGVPYVELGHAIDTPTADVAVRLSDVDPNGRSQNVSDGYASVGSEPSETLRIEFDPIAHRFRAGHRIRLTIAGGSFPRFARNLGTGEPVATGAEFVRSTHVLDCARSTLVLPRVS